MRCPGRKRPTNTQATSQGPAGMDLARLPLMTPGSLALGWPSGGGRYGVVSTALNTKDATAPFASSGAFGLVLHWPLCLPDVYLGPYPAK
jgi:hypothetical protein